jgi:hypothetical protein
LKVICTLRPEHRWCRSSRPACFARPTRRRHRLVAIDVYRSEKGSLRAVEAPAEGPNDRPAGRASAITFGTPPPLRPEQSEKTHREQGWIGSAAQLAQVAQQDYIAANAALRQ